jgi:hypothetical protein
MNDTTCHTAQSIALFVAMLATGLALGGALRNLAGPEVALGVLACRRSHLRARLICRAGYRVPIAKVDAAPLIDDSQYGQYGGNDAIEHPRWRSGRGTAACSGWMGRTKGDFT